MEEEIKTITERDVWTLVPRPKDERILGNRWVYTIKYNDKNQIVRYKARLVAQGYRQVKGVSYDEVFSPVVNFSIIRFFFSLLVSHLGWRNEQFDINGAYLYAPLDKVIYMDQPVGFEDPRKPHHVCLLKRALYGLHQSGRQWFFKIHETLTKLGFRKLDWANCVYVKSANIVLLLYVDDMVAFAKTQKEINEVLELVKNHFDLKRLGKTNLLLGVQFEYTKNGLVIHQSNYIDKVYDKYTKYKIPISSLPVSKSTILSKSDCPGTETEVEEMKAFPYRNVIGCLAFVASRTRPDISYAVNILSQFQSNPGMPHWDALVRLLGYLRVTQNYKLKLECPDQLKINCYTDADYASNRDDRVSMGGLMLMLNESPISWRTSKQKCVSLSTMESEFVALTEAAKELLWHIRIADEIVDNKVVRHKIPGLMWCDNQSTINFAHSPIENSRTKHISIRYHFVRDLVYQNLFNLKYINTKSNVADIFTKAPTKEMLHKFCNRIFV